MKLTRRDFGLLAIIIYFTFIGGTFYSQLNFWLRVANQLLVTLLLGGWLAARIKRGQGLPATGLDAALAVYLGVNLAAALAGLSPRYSLESMWFSVVHVLALYLLVDLARRGWTARLVWAFYMASAVVCLVGLAEFAGWYVGTPLFSGFAQGWWDIGGWQQPVPPKIYRLNITLNGSTPLSAYLALLTTPALGLVLSLPRKSENRQALIIWLGLAVVVQILTFSRAGILALGVSLPLLAAGWLRVQGKTPANLWTAWLRQPLATRLFAVLGGVVVAGAGLFWVQHSFANRAGSTNFRFVLWQTALTIFKNHPLTGVGPANFGRALLRFNDPQLPHQQITTAHSIYLNTAAELGLLGLLAGAGLMAGLGWVWLNHWRQAHSPASRVRLAACAAALAGLAAQTVVDTYTATPNMLVMLAVVAFIAVKPPSGVLTRRPYTAVIALAGVLVYAAGFVWLAAADLHYQNSFKQERAGRLPAAVAAAARARAIDPALPLRTFRLALLEARQAAQTDNPAIRQSAVEHYRAALRQEPVFGLNSANLAGLLWQQGRRAGAISMMQQSVAAMPDPLFWVNLGYFFEQEGDWERAAEAYGQALARSPRLAASGFWAADPARATRWPDFVNAALPNVKPVGEPAQRLWRAYLAFYHDDFETVAALAEPVTPETDPRLVAVLARLYLVRGRPEQAGPLLAFAPETGEDYFLQGWLGLQTGHKAEAEKLLKTARFLGWQEAGYLLGQLAEQQGDLHSAELAYSRAFPARAASENEDITMYGRAGGNDLAPQLLRIGVGPRQAEPWLALARLYEKQRRPADAARVYRLLLAEDPYLAVARERLAALPSGSEP